MKKVGLFIIFLVSIVCCYSQYPCTNINFTLPEMPSQQELENQNLAWIKTCNDFDQGSLNSEGIDKEIEKRIKNYNTEMAIVAFDIPVNKTLLIKPTEKKLFKDFDPTYNIGIINNVLPQTEGYFWKYRDIDISVPGNTYLDQYIVYSTARAIEILRCRYPRAYQKLFVESRIFSVQPPTLGSFINRLKKILIAFHNQTTSAIAESGTILGKNETPAASYGKYSNLAVITFHEQNLRGNTALGSSVLYQRSASENFIRYLREGIVETLVHEMLHRFIETRRNLDKTATIVTNARDGMLPLNLQWEEIFIANTSLSFFVKEGGFQPFIPFYYRNILDGNVLQIHNLRLAGIPNDASRLENLGCCNYLEVMKFDYLN